MPSGDGGKVAFPGCSPHVSRGSLGVDASIGVVYNHNSVKVGESLSSRGRQPKELSSSHKMK